MHSFIHSLIPSVIRSTFIFLNFYNQPSTGQVNKDPYVKEAWFLPEGAQPQKEQASNKRTHLSVEGRVREGHVGTKGHQGQGVVLQGQKRIKGKWPDLSQKESGSGPRTVQQAEWLEWVPE